MFYIQFLKFFIEKISKSLISSFLVSDMSKSLRSLTKMSDVSKLLRSLTKNEQPWVFRSGQSEEMSDREQIAQVAHQKWANEWMNHFLSESLIR